MNYDKHFKRELRNYCLFLVGTVLLLFAGSKLFLKNAHPKPEINASNPQLDYENNYDRYLKPVK